MKRIASVLAALVIASCGGPAAKPRSVEELAAEPLVLQGLVARCVADRRHAATDLECRNARVAMDRVGKIEDAKREPGYDAEFERQRQLRREREDQERRAAVQAQPKFDPYSSPVATEPAETPPKR